MNCYFERLCIRLWSTVAVFDVRKTSCDGSQLTESLSCGSPLLRKGQQRSVWRTLSGVLIYHQNARVGIAVGQIILVFTTWRTELACMRSPLRFAMAYKNISRPCHGIGLRVWQSQMQKSLRSGPSVQTS